MIRMIGRTIRFEVDGIENYKAATADGRAPIYAAWHDRIFLGTYYLRDRGIVFLTSQSFDGEYIARFLQRFGFGVIRGSSTRGGAKGLVEMIRVMRKGTPMGFTVDGPKGPRYEAKPGPILLAKKTGQPILPFSLEISKFTTVRSWDKLQIPLPFSRARIYYGPPIFVPENADKAVQDERLAQLQTALELYTELGRQWRESL